MSAPTPRSGSLLRSPAVLYDGQWWLVSGAGAIPVIDPTFTGVLDRFTAAAAPADRAVTELRTRRSDSPSSDVGSWR